MDKISLGERICSVRESGNHSQEELALAVGVTNVTISRYEKGHRTPDAEFLNRLVELYGCDPGWLLTGKGNEPKKTTISPRAAALLDNYEALNEEDKRAFERMALTLAECQKITRKAG